MNIYNALVCLKPPVPEDITPLVEIENLCFAAEHPELKEHKNDVVSELTTDLFTALETENYDELIAIAVKDAWPRCGVEFHLAVATACVDQIKRAIC